MTATTVTPADVAARIIAATPLTAHDRCDHCYVARAAVKVRGRRAEFVFCRHHYDQHRAELSRQFGALSVTDSEGRLTA